MKTTIEIKTQGWVLITTNKIAVNIHPGCDGKAGELRDAALRVCDLIGLMETSENEESRRD